MLSKMHLLSARKDGEEQVVALDALNTKDSKGSGHIRLRGARVNHSQSPFPNWAAHAVFTLGVLGKASRRDPELL